MEGGKGGDEDLNFRTFPFSPSPCTVSEKTHDTPPLMGSSSQEVLCVRV